MRKFISGAVLSVAMGLSAVSGANAAALPGLTAQYDAFLAACVPTPTPTCQVAIQAYLAAAAQQGYTLTDAVASLRSEAPGNTALQAAITTASGGTAAGPGDGSPS